MTELYAPEKFSLLQVLNFLQEKKAGYKRAFWRRIAIEMSGEKEGFDRKNNNIQPFFEQILELTHPFKNSTFCPSAKTHLLFLSFNNPVNRPNWTFKKNKEPKRLQTNKLLIRSFEKYYIKEKYRHFFHMYFNANNL